MAKWKVTVMGHPGLKNVDVDAQGCIERGGLLVFVSDVIRSSDPDKVVAVFPNDRVVSALRVNG